MTEKINIKEIENKLRSYNAIQVEIKNLELDLEDYRPTYSEGKIYAGGGNTEGVIPGKVTARPVSSLIENALIGNITDIDIKIFRLQECRKMVKKIDNILDIIPKRDRRIIEGFYIKRETLAVLALELERTPEYLSLVKKNIIKKYFKTLSNS